LSGGLALRMQLELRHAQRIAGVQIPSPAPPLPLRPPCEGDLIIEGYCAPASGPDQTNQMFIPMCWTRPFGEIPLLAHHDPAASVGQVLELSDRPDGLWVRARVTEASAKRLPALSLAAEIHDYRIRDACAEITSATITEVTLTDRPAHLGAIWNLPSPEVRYFDLMGERVRCLLKLSEALRTMVKAQRAPELPAQPVVPRYERPSLPPSQFATLVNQLNDRHPL
jgi:hypothetical protein